MHKAYTYLILSNSLNLLDFLQNIIWLDSDQIYQHWVQISVLGLYQLFTCVFSCLFRISRDLIFSISGKCIYDPFLYFLYITHKCFCEFIQIWLFCQTFLSLQIIFSCCTIIYVRSGQTADLLCWCQTFLKLIQNYISLRKDKGWIVLQDFLLHVQSHKPRYLLHSFILDPRTFFSNRRVSLYLCRFLLIFLEIYLWLCQ